MLIALVMLITAGCTPANNNSGDVDNTTPDPSAQATPSATIDVLGTATPTPKAMKPLADDKEEAVVKTIVNKLPEKQSNFEGVKDIKKETSWICFDGGKIELSTDEGVDDSQCLKFTNLQKAWTTPMLNIANFIDEPGDYIISYSIKLVGDDIYDISGAGFDCIIRAGSEKDANSFLVQSNSNGLYRYAPSAAIDGEIGELMTVEFPVSVLDTDLDGKKHTWNLGMHQIKNDLIEAILIDNVSVGFIKVESEPEKEKLVTQAEMWLKNEMTFLAQKPANDPLNTQTLDVIFTNGSTEFTMPGFWDGANIWRVRFALPSEGTWTFKTVFSDTADAGVHNKTGSITCTKYSGDLDIYKHGFVKTDADKRYFVYADGTPFFYLGDTHWNFLAEEFDRAGTNAGDTVTSSHFKYIVNKRVAQGYTVYQTEPLEANWDLVNGLDAGDISAFKLADKYFEYIADQGLVHANAQFFFASSMNLTVMNKPNYEKLLDTLSRYWVARFGAYPVMYTLAQEVDNDFYYMENTMANTTMNAEANPWKLVCQYLHKYDPYKNPISAHQEGSTVIMNHTTASNSAFRDIEGHTWWANQWKPKLDIPTPFSAAKDFWDNGQGKPAVVYEGRYDSLWTNEYGARAQGWLAFLNGMYGHGYGAVDIWLYKSEYDIEYDTVRDGITITVEQKMTPWSKSIEFPAGYQMGYMRELLEKYEWWNLVPVFDNTDVFAAESLTYSMATINTNDVYICYLYDAINKPGTKLTGTVKGLDANADYVYKWYNPRTNVLGSAMPIAKGDTFKIGERPSAEDWVLIVEKVK